MNTHTAKVLVIDDDEDIRSTISDALQEEGYVVGVAANGADGLALLRDGFRPCVILLDLAMRVMDGWDFRAAQLLEPAFSSIPVVVTSAAGFSVSTMRTQFGDVEVLPKPVAVEDLLAAIGRACSKH
jgi:two-component system, chemotaxis family, chemotaxis protein CheY